MQYIKLESMKKEQVYVSLIGKTKEELTDLWEFLNENKGSDVIDGLGYFYNSKYLHYQSCLNRWWTFTFLASGLFKTEVTIEQLKEILKPMGTFTPIAMKCTQEQFNAVKPKLYNCKIQMITNFNEMKYLINNRNGYENNITNYTKMDANDGNRKVHEEWNEEIFLKSCGIEVETLEQQLQKAKSEVERIEKIIEEENKPKPGDWVKNTFGTIFKLKEDQGYYRVEKITNPQLIKLLEQEVC